MGILITDEQATGKIKDIFDEIRTRLGIVPNFFRAQASESPDMLTENWNRWKTIMGE